MASLIARTRNRLASFRWHSFAIVLGSFLIVLLCDGFVADVLITNYTEAVENTDEENDNLTRILEKYILTNMQGIDLLISSTARAIEASPALKTPSNPRLLDLL